ncbi:hypothetical protein LZ30DRAFT_343822 [Colletotrichum cereale]|nr:hypothetical protein LZ30DRAFT_343822 [Colletotrichum cereale]
MWLAVRDTRGRRAVTQLTPLSKANLLTVTRPRARTRKQSPDSTRRGAVHWHAARPTHRRPMYMRAIVSPQLSLHCSPGRMDAVSWSRLLGSLLDPVGPNRLRRMAFEEDLLILPWTTRRLFLCFLFLRVSVPRVRGGMPCPALLSLVLLPLLLQRLEHKSRAKVCAARPDRWKSNGCAAHVVIA